MQKTKGFTIIELLVVVAIIAVLAAIVLVNVTGYINKGRDAAIKGNIATIMTNAAVWYDSNVTYPGTYRNFSADATYTVPAAAITSAGKAATSATKVDYSAFCVCTTLYDTTNGTYCADSSGYKKQTNTACNSRCTATTALCAD